MGGGVSAQAPELPQQWFPERAPTVAGQRLYFCIDEREPGSPVDREIARAIAQALLVEPVFVEVGRQAQVEAEFEALYVDLVDRCTVYMGFKVYADAYPAWLSFTRPAYEARFVVLTAVDGPAHLRDFAPGAAIGSVQGTLGDIRFLTYNNTLPANQRWRRVPLGSPWLALSALAEGRVAALIIWEPWWWALRQEEPGYRAFKVVEAPLVSEPWIGVGGALLANRTTSRLMLDEAIAALQDDGTTLRILQELEFPGRPAGP